MSTYLLFLLQWPSHWANTFQRPVNFACFVIRYSTRRTSDYTESAITGIEYVRIGASIISIPFLHGDYGHFWMVLAAAWPSVMKTYTEDRSGHLCNMSLKIKYLSH